MNVVTQKTIHEGCEIDKRFTLYLSNYEFACISAIVRALAIPFPTDCPSGARAEDARLALLAELPAVVNRSLLMMCDELCKAL